MDLGAGSQDCVKKGHMDLGTGQHRIPPAGEGEPCHEPNCPHVPKALVRPWWPLSGSHRQGALPGL